jgi:hypothetical protein
VGDTPLVVLTKEDVEWTVYLAKVKRLHLDKSPLIPAYEKLMLGMHTGALSGIMLTTVARDSPLVLGGGSGRRIPYGRRLAEKEPANLSG